MKLPFSIKTNVTLDDVFEFSNQHYSILRSSSISFIIVSIISAMHLYQGIQEGNILFNIVTTLIIYCILGGILGFQYYSRKKNTTKLYNDHIEDFNKEYTLTAESINIKSASFDLKTKWSAFLKIEDSPNLILLYTNKYEAHLIPKRCFSNQEEIQPFINWVSSKIS